MKNLTRLALIPLILGSGTLTSCDKLNPADKAAELLHQRTEELEGTWRLESAGYTYKEKDDGVWKTMEDTLFPDASGQMTIVYLDSFDFDGDYDWTFNDSSQVTVFSGNYTNAALEFIRLHTSGEQYLVDGQTVVDYYMPTFNEDELVLQRILAIPEVNERKWELQFSRQP